MTLKLQNRQRENMMIGYQSSIASNGKLVMYLFFNIFISFYALLCFNHSVCNGMKWISEVLKNLKYTRYFQKKGKFLFFSKNIYLFINVGFLSFLDIIHLRLGFFQSSKYNVVWSSFSDSIFISSSAYRTYMHVLKQSVCPSIWKCNGSEFFF